MAARQAGNNDLEIRGLTASALPVSFGELYAIYLILPEARIARREICEDNLAVCVFFRVRLFA